MKYEFDNVTHTLVCAVDPFNHFGEYTLCGNAIPDTTMKDDNCTHIGDLYEGKLNNVTCPNCMIRIDFYKNIK